MPQDGTAQVLRRLTPQRHPDLLVGVDTLDDAGVFRLTDDLALVQTTDFFPPLIDDPYQFGCIAAANALSDVYAMGGTPLTALNLVGWPDKQLSYDLLAEILRGGADTVAEAGAVIVGGHSVRDSEIKYGLAVTGRIHPDHILTNAGVKPGDKLVLTKPLGTGVLCSAAKGEVITEEELAEAIRVMTALNKPGAEAALAVGVNACTDITGFGLIGHAFELADASDVTITLHAAAVPLLERTLDLAEAGIVTRAARTARNFLGTKLQIDDVDETLADVLADAQTSGGLLLSVPADRCDAPAVPLLERTLDLAEAGIVTRAARTARNFLGPKLQIDDVDEILADVLADAQTSGGLLLSVPADRCDALVAELQSAGALCAAVVGEATPPTPVRISVKP